MAGLGEPGGGEDAAAAHVELVPGDRLAGLRDHRVALERTGAATPGEVDGGPCERGADAPASEPGASEDAGHRPDGVVALVLPAALPGDAVVPQQAGVSSA